MTAVRLLSVNVGLADKVGAKSGKSGIFKRPVTGPVEIGSDGLTGDTIVDRDNHGGPDQAVYLYATGDYDWWSTRLGRPLPPGTFGENLTVSGVETADLGIGDRIAFGPVLLEITSPRIPCQTLAARMQDPGFVRAFNRAGRCGAYARVLTGGTVEAGQDGRRVPYEGAPVPVAEVLAHWSDRQRPEAMNRRWLAAPSHWKLRKTLLDWAASR